MRLARIVAVGLALAACTKQQRAGKEQDSAETRTPETGSAPAAPSDVLVQASAPATSDVQLLRTLAERLCSVATGSDDEIRAALAMSTTPPPFGASKLSVTGGVLSRASVELTFATPTFTRAHLDATFGAGRDLPRSGPFSAYVLGYSVAVAGAPAQVSLYARFSDKPEPTSGAKSLLLRIDPSSP